ncbi:elongation factor P [Candidatus Collierbacteria bacterium RIFCSPLOWO2_01_FULL_50_23]|uniref:Elongation factor P n=2 Tax=Candidatus Collieribacteriota TaxID=1752725 RepID=A0A1F5EY01_9BACT|nr:MAG: elongation factor P [Candidatus Collierbacteria bacterium RIFCSPHIGHO2_01_FULL_50_25]OGD73818.1 MAG: elongation factor P [Candidatus Collierbacteria bacterium RIFCSPLOWO2_01_FULL_50_23]
MIDVNKLKVGVTFVDEGTPWKVMKYDFIKMGRGGATIKVKARNLVSGSIITKSFQSGNMVEDIALEKRHLQYLYKDDEKIYFMDPISFEQVELPVSTVGDDISYLVEGEKSWVLYWNERVLGVEVPASVVMEVTEAEHWEKGNSVSNLTKPVKVASGLTVMAPLFIKKGDKLKINTEEGSYIGRVN